MPSLTPATRRRPTRRSRSACAAKNARPGRGARQCSSRLGLLAARSVPQLQWRGAVPCSPEAERRSGRTAPGGSSDIESGSGSMSMRMPGALRTRQRGQRGDFLRPREIRCPTGGASSTSRTRRTSPSSPLSSARRWTRYDWPRSSRGSGRRLSAMYDGQAVSSRCVVRRLPAAPRPPRRRRQLMPQRRSRTRRCAPAA